MRIEMKPLVVAALAMLIGADDAEASTCSGVYDFTGALQSCTVEASGVYRIAAAGAQGGAGILPGGLGGQVTADVWIAAGRTLTLLVGGVGGDASAFGERGGGGGGGASAILSDAIAIPLLVAGGGGGFGFQVGLPGGLLLGGGGFGGASSPESAGGGGGFLFPGESGLSGGGAALFDVGQRAAVADASGGSVGASADAEAGAPGGFGGGGGGASFRGGGGGGYEGGAGGDLIFLTSFGGSSFILDVATPLVSVDNGVAEVGINSGDGSIAITPLTPSLIAVPLPGAAGLLITALAGFAAFGRVTRGRAPG